MTNVTIPGLTLLSSIDRAADLFEVSDTSDSGNSKKTTVNSILNLASQPLGLTDIQSPTNKTFDNTNTITLKDTLFTLQDDGDVTKQAKFQLSGITTGTTRTYTLPNASSTLVDLTSTQNLSGKTLTSPTITTATISNPTLTVDTVSEFTAANGVTVDGLNIKDSKLNTNNSVVTANITDLAVTNAKLAANTAWTTWTPTLTNLTNGSTPTTNYAKYQQIGKIINFRLKLTLLGSSINGLPRFSLPVTANSDYLANDISAMSGQLNDATGFRWNPAPMFASTTAVDISYWNTSANAASVSSTVPFTWAVGDQIMITGSYEAA